MSGIYFNNIAAQRAIRGLNANSDNLSRSMERLSSGLRINRAVDDAASLAIASSLRKDTRVYEQGIRNINDGISMLNIADGSLAELSSVLTRVKELITQSANGTFSLPQRKSLYLEGAKLVDEFNRIVGSTAFNNVRILEGGQGTTRLQLGYGIDGSIGFVLAQELQRSQGIGTFSGEVNAGTTSGGQQQRVADFNNDGYDDLLVAGSSAGTVNVLLNNKNGGFSSTTYDMQGTGAIQVGDFNNDGNLDIIATGSGEADIRLGNGDGTFGSLNAASIAAGGNYAQVGDFNNDGNLDLISVSTNRAFLALGNGQGSFSSSSLVIATSHGNISDIAVGDFNGDDKLDVALGNTGTSTVETFLGGGNGAFTVGATVTLNGSATELDVGDFNNDGYDDIVGATGSRVSHYFLSTGADFGTGVSLGAVMAATKIDVADVNGDGFLDIIGGYGTGTRVLFSKGDGTFINGGITATTTSDGRIALGDFNADGALDLSLSSGANVNIVTANTNKTTAIGKFYLLDRAGALNSMEQIDNIMSSLVNERGKIGSNMSRLGTALANLQSTAVNYSGAASRILDADIADEAANSVRLGILRDTSAAVLSQANNTSDIVLSLLDFN